MTEKKEEAKENKGHPTPDRDPDIYVEKGHFKLWYDEKLMTVGQNSPLAYKKLHVGSFADNAAKDVDEIIEFFLDPGSNRARWSKHTQAVKNYLVEKELLGDICSCAQIEKEQSGNS